MMNCLAVGAGGFIGAVLRYLIGLIPVKETTVFPIRTFVINIVGCILIGCIAALTIRNIPLNPKLVLFLKTGLCGGFTTFSTFALETSDLLKAGHPLTAVTYAVLSAVIGIIVIFAIGFFAEKA